MSGWLCCCLGRNEERREILFLILGLDGAGKTSVLRLYAKNEIVGNDGQAASHQSAETKQGIYDIMLVDMAGSQRLRTLWKNYFPKAHGVIFVVDSSNVSRMLEAKTVLKQVATDEHIARKPLLVLANKQDLGESLDEIAIFNQLELETLQTEHSLRCQVECCSAKQGKRVADTGMKSGMVWLLNEVKQDYFRLRARVNEDTARQNTEEQLAKGQRLDKMKQQGQQRQQRRPATAAPAAQEVLAQPKLPTFHAPVPKRRHTESAPPHRQPQAQPDGKARSVSVHRAFQAPTIPGSNRESSSTSSPSSEQTSPVQDTSAGGDRTAVLTRRPSADSVRFPVAINAPDSPANPPVVVRKPKTSDRRGPKRGSKVEPALGTTALTSTPQQQSADRRLFSTTTNTGPTLSEVDEVSPIFSSPSEQAAHASVHPLQSRSRQEGGRWANDRASLSLTSTPVHAPQPSGGNRASLGDFDWHASQATPPHSRIKLDPIKKTKRKTHQ